MKYCGVNEYVFFLLKKNEYLFDLNWNKMFCVRDIYVL